MRTNTKTGIGHRDALPASLGFFISWLGPECQGLEKPPVKCDSLQHERVTQAECGVRKITQSA